MQTLCLMAEHLYDLNMELESFCLRHDVVKVIYRVYPEFCVAEINYN